MGVFSGTLSYMRFKVDGDIRGSLSSLEDLIAMRRFVPLSPAGEDLSSHGWVSVQHPFSDAEPVTCEEFLFAERVVLAYREDTIMLPKPLIKDQVAAKIRAYEAEHGGEKPGKETKYAINMSVISELRRRLLPRSRVVEMAWDTEKKNLRLLTRGKSMVEHFVDFFEQTFELRLIEQSFAQMATSTPASLREQGMLESLRFQEIFQHIARQEA